jgi:translocator protein
MNNSTSQLTQWLVLPLFLSLAFGAAALGAFAPPGDWYAALNKPSFNPPDWIFGPVWTVLYVMIGVAGWRIWKVAPKSAAMLWWFAQMALNAAWSPTFFGLRQMGLALVVILALWLVIGATIRAAWPLDRPAALLLVPYLAWVSFATVLNAALWKLN